MKTKSVRVQAYEFICNSARPVCNKEICEATGIPMGRVATATGAMFKDKTIKRKKEQSGECKGLFYFWLDRDLQKEPLPTKARTEKKQPVVFEEAGFEAAIEEFVRALAVRISGEVRAELRTLLK